MNKSDRGFSPWFFLACFLFGVTAYYLRYPSAYTFPNFYAEDGTLFKTVDQHGFLRAPFEPFSGYLIVGYYLLIEVGMILNRLAGGVFYLMPRSFAVTSYLFLGLTAALPSLLLQRTYSRRALAGLTFLLSFAAIQAWDYAIIGTIGNLKFVFVYWAFVLAVYRRTLPESSRKHYVADFGIALCANTALTVYPMIAFIGGAELLRFWRSHRRLSALWIGNHSVRSLLMLGCLVAPQVIMILICGMQKIPGYLDSPFQFEKTIEIFVARTSVYAFLYWCYHALNNWTACLALAAWIAVAVRFVKKSDQFAFAFGSFTIFMTTLLLMYGRPGLSGFFQNYKDSGPAQFFLGQNLVAVFLFGLTLENVLERIRQNTFRKAATAVLGVLLLLPVGQSGSFNKRSEMFLTYGTLKECLHRACAAPANPEVSIQTYPAPYCILKMPRAEVCTDEPGT